MALSFFTESAAPRDFRISSTESDSHYTKCLLCYTIKKNFYCADCIKAGNFVNSSMPYSDRFAEKQLKLHRLKANRKYVQDRCEAILLSKSRRDRLDIDTKQCRDRIQLIKLAIEQRRNSIEEKRLALQAFTQYNNELRLKLPRYQKRVSTLGKHAQLQRQELQSRSVVYDEKAQSLAALRRARIRQLVNYIFPVYISYDTSDSVEEMEFLKVESDDEPPKRVRLHVVAPWLSADCDFSDLHYRMTVSREAVPSESEPPSSPASRSRAALGFAAQLTSLLAWCLDVRLPHAVDFREWGAWRASPASLEARARRLRTCVWATCARGAQSPPSGPLALLGLHTVTAAALADDPALGRVEGWVMWEARESEPEEPSPPSDEDEPEHLQWADLDPDRELPHPEGSPPGPTVPPPSSLVTSLASIWRGWTK